jgi:hypothetical protein
LLFIWKRAHDKRSHQVDRVLLLWRFIGSKLMPKWYCCCTYLQQRNYCLFE